MNTMHNKKQPLGVLLLGIISSCLLGVFVLVSAMSLYIKATPQDAEQVAELFQEKGIALTLTLEQFKMIMLIQAAVALFFAVSGFGILKAKNWARKLIVYFSFAWVIALAIGTLLQPSFIAHNFFQLVYPGVLLFYFTNKNVEAYFVRGDKKPNPNSMQ